MLNTHNQNYLLNLVGSYKEETFHGDIMHLHVYKKKSCIDNME
jgi:hypothetical protein